MSYNYYCNGEGFDVFEDAGFYREVLIVQFRIYKAIYTRTEIQSMMGELA